jgi:hypothetical protein
MKMRQHDVAKRAHCRASRASAQFTGTTALPSLVMVNAALRRGRSAVVGNLFSEMRPFADRRTALCRFFSAHINEI